MNQDEAKTKMTRYPKGMDSSKFPCVVCKNALWCGDSLDTCSFDKIKIVDGFCHSFELFLEFADTVTNPYMTLKKGENKTERKWLKI